MKLRPLFRRYVVFTVPYRAKRSGSGLYLGMGSRGSYNRAENIWIVHGSNLCRSELKMGDHCWIYDAFELYSADLNLWDEYKDLKEFEGLKRFVEACEGQVETRLIAEDQILAIDNEYEAISEDRGLVWR